eukprot:11763999-Alexandrium_andersonii.AAC.1
MHPPEGTRTDGAPSTKLPTGGAAGHDQTQPASAADGAGVSGSTSWSARSRLRCRSTRPAGQRPRKARLRWPRRSTARG